MLCAKECCNLESALKTTAKAKLALQNTCIDAVAEDRANFDNKRNNRITARMMNALTLINNGGEIIQTIRRHMREIVMHLPTGLPQIQGCLSEKSTDWQINEKEMFMQPTEDETHSVFRDTASCL